MGVGRNALVLWVLDVECNGVRVRCNRASTRHTFVRGIPLESQTVAETGSGPISAGNLMVCTFKSGDEMVGVGARSVVNAEIINDEDEDDVFGVMPPEARGDGDRAITMRCQEGNDLCTRANGMYSNLEVCMHNKANSENSGSDQQGHSGRR